MRSLPRYVGYCLLLRRYVRRIDPEVLDAAVGDGQVVAPLEFAVAEAQDVFDAVVEVEGAGFGGGAGLA